jgi:spore coat protein U-like protein
MTGHRNPVAIALLLASLCWPAQRAQATTTCSASTTPLSFGTVTGATNVDNTAVVTITCNTFGLSLLATARVRMCLNIGAGVNGNNQTNPRRMTNSFGDPLQFQIYRDPARSQIWGDSSIPATPTPVVIDLEYSVPVLGGGGNTSATLYARVPVQAGLAAGGYSNPFTGSHTRLDYHYAEQLLGTPPYPASCTSGGDGGGSITFPFTASATVPNNCSIASAGNLEFGSVAGTITANRDQTSTLTFTCTGRTAWNVGLDNGQNASGSFRRMRLGTSNNYVTYDLYRDAARTQRWGTTIGADTATGTGSGSAQSLTVHGRVPATQAVPAGLYRDVVTVTVTY